MPWRNQITNFTLQAHIVWCINPLTHGRFPDPYFKVLCKGVKLNFLIFFIGASATKRFARSRIFRYGCLMIILSNRHKEREGALCNKRLPVKYAGIACFVASQIWSHFAWISLITIFIHTIIIYYYSYIGLGRISGQRIVLFRVWLDTGYPAEYRISDLPLCGRIFSFGKKKKSREKTL